MKGDQVSKNNKKAKYLSEIFLQLEQEVRILEIRRKYGHNQGLFDPSKN
ncbi:MAG: hypothetical protein ACOC31_02045 [Bacteroidota bacterium]